MNISYILIYISKTNRGGIDEFQFQNAFPNAEFMINGQNRPEVQGNLKSVMAVSNINNDLIQVNKFPSPVPLKIKSALSRR